MPRAVIAAAGDRADAQPRERLQPRLSGNLAQSTLRGGGVAVSGLTWSFGPLQVVFPVLDGGAPLVGIDDAGSAMAQIVAIAAGGYHLMPRDLYDRVGGHAAIRGQRQQPLFGAAIADGVIDLDEIQHLTAHDRFHFGVLAGARTGLSLIHISEPTRPY